ncbi:MULTISPECIES: hypothetical protein [Mycetohabitans]|uniref:hypothetical protein n=1 Tax=Mycetohabitans TaxID=2571159 RepID=UPI0005A15F94|nr:MULTISPECIES: hypothetical protein [Mycetohabitans]MCG1047937.1 hypothetical protein [Mycetohabitans sp. B6]
MFWKDRVSRYFGCNKAFAQDAGLAYPAPMIGKRDAEPPWRERAESYHAIDVDSLKARSCDKMQGFLFSRPIPGNEVAVLLASVGQQPSGGHQPSGGSSRGRRCESVAT